MTTMFPQVPTDYYTPIVEKLGDITSERAWSFANNPNNYRLFYTNIEALRKDHADASSCYRVTLSVSQQNKLEKAKLSSNGYIAAIDLSFKDIKSRYVFGNCALSNEEENPFCEKTPKMTYEGPK